MAYESIDKIQNALATEVFKGATDKKKAAGRALGTIIELISYYLLRQWGLRAYLTIELRMPEFGNADITHNVEFGLHPLINTTDFLVEGMILPLTPSKLMKLSPELRELLSPLKRSTSNLLCETGRAGSRVLLQTNACLLAVDLESGDRFIANAEAVDVATRRVTLSVSRLKPKCFAMVECKRVGVEEGAKKGPTTIEKAKQGAYVAKHVSSLQKVRLSTGEMRGAFGAPDGTLTITGKYAEALYSFIHERPASDLVDFVLTIGVASNHGNWFTADDPNKELRVLKQSYDWLLFLTDAGLAEFVEDVILSKKPEAAVIRNAFDYTYGGGRKKGEPNRLTKKVLVHEAHAILEEYFAKHLNRIESDWFTILSPDDTSLAVLKAELHTLIEKNW